MSLIEVMISVLLMSLVVTMVDVSISVVQKQQIQVSDRTQALDNLQAAQEAVTRDIHAAVTWTTPAAPTSLPAQPITATSLAFTASLNGATPTINISLNTTTHVLSVTCSGSTVGCYGNAVQLANVDSSSLFTLTTDEVSNSSITPATNQFFFTSVSSVLTLDTPKVGAEEVFQTTLTEPTLVPFTTLFDCQSARLITGASGSC